MSTVCASADECCNSKISESNDFNLAALSKDFYLCYECAVFKHKDRMQKYECSVCEGRKCLDVHTTDEILECPLCGQKELCNDCLGFGRCCQIYKDGQYYLRKDKSYFSLTGKSLNLSNHRFTPLVIYTT